MLDRRHWIFDLDGTLTVAVHDFDALRDELDLPRGHGILEAIDALPEAARRDRLARVEAWEWEHAERAVAEPDAVALLDALRARGARLAVLTRNRHAIAWRTLEVAGLAGYFAPETCLGRDEAEPKPSPDGVLRLLAAWGARPDDAVMVGDWKWDVIAGRAAGTATVLVERRSERVEPGLADVVVDRLDRLLGR